MIKSGLPEIRVLISITLTDLKLRKAHLQRSVKDKYVNNKGFILYEILVKVFKKAGFKQMSKVRKAGQTSYGLPELRLLQRTRSY